jgi:hypothetical protein
MNSLSGMQSSGNRLPELRRQLHTVRSRIDKTIAEFAKSKSGLTTVGLSHVPAQVLAAEITDILHACVRLEVTLAESVEYAERPGERSRQIARGDLLPTSRNGHRSSTVSVLIADQTPADLPG